MSLHRTRAVSLGYFSYVTICQVCLRFFENDLLRGGYSGYCLFLFASRCAKYLFGTLEKIRYFLIVAGATKVTSRLSIFYT
jgi:hypothetical protein